MQIYACIDTASSQSVISLELAILLKLDIKETVVECSSVNNQIFDAVGESVVRFKIGNSEYDITVLIFDDFEDDALLGSDFHQITDMKIDYRTNFITIQYKEGFLFSDAENSISDFEKNEMTNADCITHSENSRDDIETEKRVQTCSDFSSQTESNIRHKKFKKISFHSKRDYKIRPNSYKIIEI